MHFFLQFISPGNIQKWPFKSDVLTTNSLLFPELPIYLSPFSRYTILLPEIALMFSRSIFLFSILFSLRALCWPTYDAFLKTLKRPQGVWFFCLFYSNFSINFNLENTVTEYLKWLKMGESFNQDIALIKTFLWYKFDSVFQPLEKQNVCAYNIVWVHVFRTFLSEDRFSW